MSFWIYSGGIKTAVSDIPDDGNVYVSSYFGEKNVAFGVFRSDVKLQCLVAAHRRLVADFARPS